MRRQGIAAAALVLMATGRVLAADELETALVEREGAGGIFVADGAVEAVRQSNLSPQVTGRVTALTVKAGDVVRAGEVLARIDERAAVQQVAMRDAQAAASRAQLDASRKEVERSRRLYDKAYISKAAMDQAEAQFHAAEALSRASLAQVNAAGTEASFHTVAAPYRGVVDTVSAELGDMATPGRPLVSIYDPSRLRVVAHLPESAALNLKSATPVRVELPGAGATVRWQDAQSVMVLPSADPVSHTIEVRLELRREVPGLRPGMYAKAYIPVATEGDSAIVVPAKAMIRRSELFAVYVVDRNGQPRLRQVRPGRVRGDRVQILAGLEPGERVALDPLAAAAWH